MNNEEEIKKGLLGIVVDETTISQVVLNERINL